MRNLFIKNSRYIKTFVSSILSGIFITFGGMSYLYLNHLGQTFFAALSFCFGLLLISFLSCHLFTGKIGFIFTSTKKELIELPIIYIGNFIGACLFGLMFKYILNVVPSDQANTFADYIISVGQSRVINLSGDDLSNFNAIFKPFVSSIICGMCVFLAVNFYKVFKSYGMKVISVIIPITAFVLMGAQHCIANMFYLTIASKWNAYSTLNIFIVTIGNALGSIIIYWAVWLIKKEFNKKEVSAGAVIYKNEECGIKYLLITMTNGKHTTLCKGHVEKNESLEACALREIKEETNFDVILDTDFHEVISYKPYKENENIVKDVHFYIAEEKTNKKPQDLHDNEVESYQFVSYEEALKLLTHESDKDVLTKANRYLLETKYI